LLAFYRSAIGKKFVMGVTGLIGISFVVVHMTGNLLAFAGRETINAYSHFLKETGELLVIARVTLVVALVLHVVAAVQLARQSRAARPIGYAALHPQASTFASRSMRWGGLLLLVFIVFHIMHFTTGAVRPQGAFSSSDVYSNIVTSFQIWWVTLIYLVAMVLLGLHLFHGAWSSPRSLGVSPRKANPLHRKLPLFIAAVLWLGFVAVPIGVALGVIR
nr:succinate dehydrogenase cytochrome b subunit [Chloroflexota bacterium]